MLTNQDRRAILEQVKTSGSGDIIAALRGQVSTEPMQNPAPTQEPINIPQSPQPVDVDLETTPALPSNLVDSTAALPTQLAKTGGVKKSHGGAHEEEESFEDSTLGKFLNIKGLKRDGEYIMNTVGDYFGYENTVEDARRMLLDGSASLNPVPDLLNAVDHAQQGKYTDAALYAGFAGLPFTAGPLVRGAKQVMQKAKGKFVNTLKDKLLKTRTPIGNTDMVLETDSKLAKIFEKPLKAGESKLVAQVKNKYGPALKGGSDEFINLSYNKSNTGFPNDPDFYSFDEMFFDKMRTAGQSVKATENIIPKYSFIGNKPGASSLSTNSLDLTLNRLKNKSKYVDATNYSGDYIQLNKYAKNKINTGKPTNLALNKFNVFTDDEFNVLQKTYFGKFGKLNSKNLLNTRGADQYRGFSKSSHKLRGLNEDTYHLGLPNMMIQKVHKKGGLKKGMDYRDGGQDNNEEENTINYRQHMMNYLHTSGRDTNMVNTVMNAIAQHESLNVDDKKQVSQRDDGTFYDGPGRGAYQFEMSDKGAASTALNRNYRFNLFNTDKELKDFPELNEFAKEKNPDFSTLSRADQDGLFIGDKIFGGPPRRNMFDLVTRNRTTPPNQEEVFQYWLRNHKGKISAVRDGEDTTVDIDKATKKEIAVERKKWNRSTKNLFKTGGYKSRYA